MSKDTAIEWCDSTVNPVMGCPGCELWRLGKGGTCYAAAMVERYRGTKGYPEEFHSTTLFPDRMFDAVRWTDLAGKERKNKPWLNGLPRTIFVTDMGDMFVESVSFDWLEEFVWSPIMLPEGRRHYYFFVTKRPTRMVEYELWQRHTKGLIRPHNVMCCTTVTTMKNMARVKKLAELPDTTPKGLMIEPILEEINLFPTFCEIDKDRPVDWIVIGAESGPNARPCKLDWIRQIRDVALEWEIPFFFKQDNDGTEKVSVPELDGRQHTEMPVIRAAGQGNLV